VVNSGKIAGESLFGGSPGRYGPQRVNRESVEKLLVTEYPGLLTLLRRKARDPQLAADLLNDALIVALNNFDSGRISDPSHIGGYVFQVAMNLLRNHRRSFGDNAAKRADLNEATLAAAPVPESLEKDWAGRVRALLEELPHPRDRTLLKRFYLDEEDKGTICSQLQISALQFDKIMFRAKKRLLSTFESRGLRKGDFFSFLLGGMVLALATGRLE
jgi:RNA polymerase sigma-70 factor (ECF subfamily)